VKQILIAVCSLTLLAACGTPHRRAPRSPMELRVEKMFKAADADADEWLTPAELETGFPWLGGKFRSVDTDGNGKVSLAEVTSYIELQSMQPEPKRKKR
jgi:hypothetical protein